MIARAATFIAERLSYAVVAVFGLAMILVAGAAADTDIHLGGIPILWNDANVVTYVDPSAASKIHKGDVLAYTALSPVTRFAMHNAVRAGIPLEFVFDRDGVRHRATVIATPPSAQANVYLDLRFVGLVAGFIVVIGLASLVFLSSPHAATLGFYFYTLVMIIKTYQSSLTALTWPSSLVADVVVQVCYPLAQFLILLFGAQIFNVNDRVSRVLLRLNAALGIIVFFAWTIPIFQDTFLVPGPDQGWWMAGSDFAQILVTLLGLAYVARVAAGPRVRVWVVLTGIALPAANDFVWSITAILDIVTNNTIAWFDVVGTWTDVLQPWFGPLGISLVCYGLVLRHVVGFRSALARTAVATLASVGLLLLFTLIDWTIGKLTGEEHNDYVNIATLLLSGFLLRLSHHRVDEIVRGVLFRGRVADDKAMHEVAGALACTASTATIYELLLAETIRILRLPGAALFVGREADAAFARVATRGNANLGDTDLRDADLGTNLGDANVGDANLEWLPSVDNQGIVAARLRANRKPMRLDAAAAKECFGGAQVPARSVAVPLFLRGELGGIAVYVDRIDDAPLDEEELHYFERLAGAAAAALDHADAVESRKLRAIGLAESQTLGFGTAGAAPAAAAVPGAVPDTLGGAGSVDIAAPVEREDAVAAVGERLEPVREPAGHVLAIYQQPGMIAPLPD